MRWLETRVPPPLVMALAALLIWGLRRTWPEMGIFIPGRRAIYGGLLGLGLLIVLAGIFEFRRARTTVNPMRPADASSLVTGGIYRITRNPMYLADVLILLAVVVFSPIRSGSRAPCSLSRGCSCCRYLRRSGRCARSSGRPTTATAPG